MWTKCGLIEAWTLLRSSQQYSGTVRPLLMFCVNSASISFLNQAKANNKSLLLNKSLLPRVPLMVNFASSLTEQEILPLQTATTLESPRAAPQVEPGISRSQHRLFLCSMSVTIKKLVEDGLLHG